VISIEQSINQITLEAKMYSIIQKDAHCAGTLFLVWGAFGIAMAAVWGVAHGTPVTDAAVWALGVAAGLGLLLGRRAL
jgi:hypothetical protein